MGLPVVASEVSGIPELVTGDRNGVLVQPDDPVALADAISRVLHAPVLCAALGAQARATVTEHFDNDRNLALLCGLLQNHSDLRMRPDDADCVLAGADVQRLPLGAK